MNPQEESSVPEIGRKGVKAILVPTDFSGYSDMALEAAAEIAAQQKARIYLVHIAGMPRITTFEERMQAQIARLPRAASVEIIPHIGKGSPDKEILKLQAEKGIDLIVIASRQSASPLHALTFAGGLAERMMKKAKCAVIVVGNEA